MTEPDVSPRFAADRTLGRLAKWLRLLGADVLRDDRLTAAQLLHRARADGRIMLTRDKRIRTAPDVVYLASHDFREQLREILARFRFDPCRRAFTRCAVCNGELRIVGRDALRRRVPPFVYASNETFAVCDGCGRVYWHATHPERMRREIAALAAAPTADEGDGGLARSSVKG